MSEKKHKRPADGPLHSRLWRFLSSPRLTIFIILALAVMGLAGILIMQAPSDIAADPDGYGQWAETIAGPRYGSWTGFLSALRFFDVFHSPWFLAAGGLLMVNILFCTARRWNAVVAVARGIDKKPAASFFRTGTDRGEIPVPVLPAGAGEMLAEALKKRRYGVSAGSSGDAIIISARKNRFSPLGTFLTHLSLILFVLGFLVTALWGFREISFVVAEGSTEEVGNGTGLALELLSFEDEYWPDGSPSDYRSEVALYSGEEKVAQALVRVNSPLSFRGISFYQAGFGPAARIQVRGSVEPVYDGSVPLTQTFVSEGVARYAGLLHLPEKGITAVLLSPAINGPDPVIAEGEMGILVYTPGVEEPAASELLAAGLTREVAGLEFTFVRQEQYSVFQVSRNPGITLVWIACAALVIGLGMVFYLPHRQLWAFIEPRDGRASRLTIRGAGKSSPGIDEIETLIEHVKEKHGKTEVPHGNP